MLHTATMTLDGKYVNPDGSIQVTFGDNTGFAYGDQASLDMDCEVRDNDFSEYLKSFLICMLVEIGESTVGKTLHLDLSDPDGNIVKVL